MTQGNIQKKENKFVFVLFSVWTFVLICRPQDLFTFLVPLRPVLVLGLFTLSLFIMTHLRSGFQISFDNLQVKLYIALILLMVIGIPFALYTRAALEGIFTGYINVIMFFLLFLVVVKTTKKLKRILFAGCLGTGLYFIFALIEGGITFKRLYFGSVFDPNDLAFFALSFLPYNLIFLSKDNNLVERFIGMGNFVIGALVIILTGSRGGFIGFCFVVPMLFLTKNKTFKLFYKIVLAGVIMIVVLTGIITPDYERFQSILNLKDDYNISDEAGRVELWKNGLRVMVSHPLTGVGFGCFGEAIGSDRGDRGLTPRWQAPHNSLIQIGTETGFAGAILFALMSFNAFRIFGKVRKKGASEELIKIGEMARIGFVGHFISGMFLSQAYSIYWAFYIVTSAVVDNLSHKEANTINIRKAIGPKRKPEGSRYINTMAPLLNKGSHKSQQVNIE